MSTGLEVSRRANDRYNSYRPWESKMSFGALAGCVNLNISDFNCSHTYSLICYVCRGCVCPRTTYRSHISPSTMWRPGVELRSSALSASTLPYLTGPSFSFSNLFIYCRIGDYTQGLSIFCKGGTTEPHPRPKF